MDHVLTSPEAVIDQLGGTQAVADLTGHGYKAVHNWRSRKLPADTFMLMSDELRKRGCEAPPSLWGMIEKGAAA